MKLDCGLSWEERNELLKDWHPYFCLLPRRVGHRDCRWLEVIERKGSLRRRGLKPDYWVWEYRSLR